MASAFSHAIAALSIGVCFNRPGIPKRHSLPFAAALAGLVTFTFFQHGFPGLGSKALFAYLFLATASHGFLDAMTDGGLGVAFFAPFSNTRYFLPWTPIRVSPIGVTRFFTDRALVVLRSEFVWIWIPAMLLALVGWGVKKRDAT